MNKCIYNPVQAVISKCICKILEYDNMVSLADIISPNDLDTAFTLIHIEIELNPDIADSLLKRMLQSERERKDMAGIKKLANQRAKKANLHNKKLWDQLDLQLLVYLLIHL